MFHDYCMVSFKIEQFEGPLDLLLALIEQEKLAITEVSLAKVTDQYIAQIQSISTQSPIEELSHFLIIAAKLILLKSRALIPSFTKEEEQEFQELQNQLKMYRIFHEAAQGLQRIVSLKQRSFLRTGNTVTEVGIFSPGNVTKEMMCASLKSILSSLQPIRPLTRISFDIKVTIQEKIHLILEMVKKRMKFSFHHLIQGASSKTEIIVSFLALLELVKQRSVFVSQQALFKDITIHHTENNP